MRVRSVRLVTSSLAAEARNAKRSWRERGLALVVVESERGAIGVGEASPLEGYSRDTFAAASRELARAATHLEGVSLGGQVKRGLAVALVRARVRSAAAIFALESALLDALAKEEGVPVWRLFAGHGRRAPISVSGLVTARAPEEAAAQARAAARRGVVTVKIKIGPRLEDDVARVVAVREAASRSMIRLDANQSGSPAAFTAMARELAPLHIALVEEPVARWRRLAPSSIPLAVDESLMHPGWESRAERPDVAAIVLKPMALGGFLRCLDWAAFAARAGLRTYVTHLFDGPVAAAAAAELALALPVPPLPCGLDVFARSADWPGHAFHRLGAATIAPTNRPGLGVELDLAAFAR